MESTLRGTLKLSDDYLVAEIRREQCNENYEIVNIVQIVCLRILNSVNSGLTIIRSAVCLVNGPKSRK